jgi:hypothetical protein
MTGPPSWCRSRSSRDEPILITGLELPDDAGLSAVIQTIEEGRLYQIRLRRHDSRYINQSFALKTDAGFHRERWSILVRSGKQPEAPETTASTAETAIETGSADSQRPQ